MNDFYENLALKSINNNGIDKDDIKQIIENPEVELLPLLHASFIVRKKYFGKKTRIHILDNVQSGNCTEDCSYCAQSKNMKDKKKNIYPMKTEEQILEEAKNAYEKNAFRHCLVFSGKDLGKNRINKISSVVKKIKNLYNMEICVSAGFLTEEDASELKNAGVNRYNHNINTSKDNYGAICKSHSFTDRLNTIKLAKKAGLDICSGIIIGMGETAEDIIKITEELKNLDVQSVPVNFFMPFEGHKVAGPQKLTPEYCLKILALFRLALPKAEIRAAGGREYHIKSLQALCLYPANSIFSQGYLTMGGQTPEETKQMILDAGFEIESVE